MENQFDEHKDQAEALAAEIIDIMTLLGKALNKVEKQGFSEQTRNKMVQLCKQTYGNMLRDLPNLFRDDLQAEIEAAVTRVRG